MYNFQRYLAIVFLLVLTFTVVVSCKPKETIQTTDDTTTQSDGDSNAVTTSDETTAEEETTATDTEPDPEKTAYQLFEEIMTPVYEAEAIDMSFNHEISYSLPGDTTYNYSYLGNTKSMIQDEKALVSTVMTLKMADITINTTSYFDGEFLYVNSGLEKIKMPMPPIEEEYENMIEESDFSDLVAETKDKITTISGTGSAESFMSLFEIMDIEEILGAFETSDVTFTITTDTTGVAYKIEYSFTSTSGLLEAPGISITMQHNGTLTVNSIGSVTITPPDDLASYIHIDDIEG